MANETDFTTAMSLNSLVNGCLSSCCCPDAGASSPDTGADKRAISASSSKKRCHDAAFGGEDHDGDRKLQHEDDGNNGTSIVVILDTVSTQTTRSGAKNAAIPSLATGNVPENGAAQHGIAPSLSQLPPPSSNPAAKPVQPNTGRWTAEEHRLFLQGLEKHGEGSFTAKCWKEIASLVKSRTPLQIRTHAQKYFQKLAKEQWKKANQHIEKAKEEAKARKKAVQLEEAAQRVAAREEAKARKKAVQLEEAALQKKAKEEAKARKKAVQLEEAALRVAVLEAKAKIAAKKTELAKGIKIERGKSDPKAIAIANLYNECREKKMTCIDILEQLEALCFDSKA